MWYNFFTIQFYLVLQPLISLPPFLPFPPSSSLKAIPCIMEGGWALDVEDVDISPIDNHLRRGLLLCLLQLDNHDGFTLAVLPPRACHERYTWLGGHYSRSRTWSLATIAPSKKGSGAERMQPRCRPFWWPCGGIEAKHVASPDAACPGLHKKPLNAAIGQLIAPYRPGGRQGDNQQNDNAKCTHFAGHVDGHCDVAVQYRAHRPMEEVHGFHRSH